MTNPQEGNKEGVVEVVPVVEGGHLVPLSCGLGRKRTSLGLAHSGVMNTLITITSPPI